MPDMADMTLNDYAAAAKTYGVLGVKDGIARWANTAQGTVAGNLTVDGEVRIPADPASQVTRVVYNAARPKVNGTTGAVDYIGRGKIEFIIPPGMSLAERQELWAMVKNLAANTFVENAVINRQGAY